MERTRSQRDISLASVQLGRALLVAFERCSLLGNKGEFFLARPTAMAPPSDPLLFGGKAGVVETKVCVRLNAALCDGRLNKCFQLRLLWRDGRDFKFRFASKAQAKFIARQ